MRYQECSCFVDKHHAVFQVSDESLGIGFKYRQVHDVDWYANKRFKQGKNERPFIEQYNIIPKHSIILWYPIAFSVIFHLLTGGVYLRAFSPLLAAKISSRYYWPAAIRSKRTLESDPEHSAKSVKDMRERAIQKADTSRMIIINTI